MAACARGEHAAFEALLGRYSGALAAGCRRALARSGFSRGEGEFEEAMAVVQERLWREAGTVFGGFRFACPLEAWLRLVAFGTALNWVGAEFRRRGEALNEAVSPAAAEDSSLEAEEELAALARGLVLLEARDREMIEDAYFRGIDYRQIAQRHGLARTSVGPILGRARERLAIIVKSLSSRDPAV